MRRETRFHKIAVLNTKGGCGKTTLATNLASYYALRGPPPTLLDHDPNGFSTRWLEKRPISRGRIVGVRAHEDGVPRLANKRIDSRSRVAIADLPANLSLDELYLHTHDADSLLIPVMPSEIDAYTTSRLIAKLILDVQLDPRAGKVAIVANRVRRNTNSYAMLKRFLASLEIPLIAVLRDCQVYVQAAALGLGIFDLPPHQARQDIDALTNVVRWLDQRQAGQAVAEDPAQVDGSAEADAGLLAPA